MVGNSRESVRPFSAAIAGRQNDSAGARNYCPRLVTYIKTVQRRLGGRLLLFPLESAVPSTQNYTVASDGPPIDFVFSEFNGVDGISLGQRILPFPPTLIELGHCRQAHA